MEELDKRKILIVAGIFVLLLVITGVCVILYSHPGVVASKNKEIARLQEVILDKDFEIEKLKRQVEDTTVKEMVLESSLKVLEGKDVPEFVRVDDKIVFPNGLMLPQSSNDISNSNIMVGSKFRFAPSDNWVCKLFGSELELYHPSGIQGKIKGVLLKDRVPQDQMKNILQGFFKGFPATTITYRNVYLSDTLAGMLASAPIKIDGEQSVVVVGFAQRSENAVLFLFVYKEDGADVNRELVDLVIRSGQYGDDSIKLE